MKAVRDHNRAFENDTYVYPVLSRRSRGLSLGVNLNPDKRCNFNCVYCEVDRRRPGLPVAVDPHRLASELSDLIGAAQSGALGRVEKFRESASLTSVIRDIAFSGDGEPTMVPNFSACIEAVAAVKQRHRLDATKLVLITNAVGLDKADVRGGLAVMDAHQGEIWGKLDAGTEGYYWQVNRSHVRLDRILSNLLLTAQARPIIVQSLFLRLRGERMSLAELEAYCDRLGHLVKHGGQIRAVHAYTIARPTPEPWATRLEEAELRKVADVIEDRTGLPVEVFA